MERIDKNHPSHHRFNHCFSIHLNGFHARFLIFVEVETEQIAFLKVIVIQIFSNLFFSLCVIFLATPDFQLYDILFPQIVYNDIGSFLITSLCFNIVVTCTIDNGAKIQQEQFSAIFFLEFIWLAAIDVIKVENKLLQNLFN